MKENSWEFMAMHFAQTIKNTATSGFTGLVLSCLAACSTVPKESPKGKAVQVIKSPFAETCTQVGKIKYDGTPFIHEKELLIIMKENAARLGGNALRLSTFTPGVTGVSNARGLGTSYRCNPEKLRAYLLNPDKGKASSETPEEETDDAAADEEQTNEAVDAAPKPKTKTKSVKKTHSNSTKK
jgi:hypothetical protein